LSAECEGSSLPLGETDRSVTDSGFLRVVPGPEVEKQYLGGYVRILSLEFYVKGFLLTWVAYAIPEETIQIALQRPEVAKYVTDWEAEDAIRFPEAANETREANKFWRRRSALSRALAPVPPSASDEHSSVYTCRSMSTEGAATVRGTAHLTPGLATETHLLSIKLGDAEFTVSV
jgi:hypothetical protein